MPTNFLKAKSSNATAGYRGLTDWECCGDLPTLAEFASMKCEVDRLLQGRRGEREKLLLARYVKAIKALDEVL